MAGPQILNFESGSIPRKPGQPVFLDQGNDAVVVEGDYPLQFLDVYFTSSEATDALNVRVAAGEVEFPDGLEKGKKIVVSGVEVGVIFDADQYTLLFDFNEHATAELVQTLIRSLTYTDTSAENGFTSTRYLTLTLADSHNNSFGFEIAVGDSIQGTNARETFTSNAGVISTGDELDGGDGDDTLSLTGGGSFYLSLMSKLAGIETIEGSSEDDSILIGSEQLAGLRQIDGKGSGTGGDKLFIYGGEIDLTAKTISGFDIHLGSDNAEITVNDFNLAQHVYGYETDNDTLILQTGTLSDDQRLLLHRHGIDTITAGGQTTTHYAPELTAFGDAKVHAERGKLTFLDVGRNAVLIVDDGLLTYLSIGLTGALDPLEKMGVDASGGVGLMDSASSGREVYVDGIHIGELYETGHQLDFYFNEDATTARVQKVIRSLTYRNDSEGGAGTRAITFTIDDVSGRETMLHFSIDLAASVPPEPNKPPTDIALQGTSVLELAANGSKVGDLSATDSAGSSFTFQILKADGTWGTTDGRFAIEGNQLKVANGLLLDHEQAKSHAIKIKVTDEGGGSYEKDFVITVGDVNPETANGSTGSDSLVGGSGDDVLNGMAGADHLVGGAGNDTYHVDNAGDRVIETATGGTADEVRTTISYTLGDHVERLTASGSGAIDLTGNALSNGIKGNAAGNRIDGRTGDDTLAGGAGNDILTGGNGKDVFLFDTAPSKSGNKDKIIDWSAKHDTIQLENAVFKALKKTGWLKKAYFVKAAKALDGNDHVGYDAKTGNLWYDHNGSKAGGQIMFAHIGKHKLIASNDFLVI
ncbi:M10 family metallopeptidase C-terminal domain-containing protein [Microvirga sp. CF3016]|uniref:M10 family metallopeptidase C-terminal domain-containing protein n=1 Tax=Microvirga sp. CF3016 TaxID=3110181 RepID=UPI002E79AABE|nr:hypothetical protein [Microvirga sp. CF3016]MEE1610413.1 hypothetical protein [Microvirga sp. CF3016]